MKAKYITLKEKPNEWSKETIKGEKTYLFSPQFQEFGLIQIFRFFNLDLKMKQVLRGSEETLSVDHRKIVEYKIGEMTRD